MVDKRDRQGVRTPADLERKYRLQERLEEQKKMAEAIAKLEARVKALEER